MYFEVKDYEIVHAHRNVTPILAHGMIPNYCLNEYFENILYPFFKDIRYPDDENEIKFWLKNQREKNKELNINRNDISTPFPYVDEPIRRFLLYGDTFAEKFVTIQPSFFHSCPSTQ
jgi:hypothetical protein